MVVVDPGLDAGGAVRAACRSASGLNVPWFAVYVDQGIRLSTAEQRQLAANLDLARTLGAEVISTAGVDAVETLLRVAQQQAVTQVVLSRPPRRAWLRHLKFRIQFGRLLRNGGHLGILLAPAEGGQHGLSLRGFESGWKEYARALAILALVTVLGGAIERALGYPSVPLIYLFALTVASLFLGRWPVVMLAVGSALAWWFFYMPTRFSLKIARPEDELMLALFLVVALVSGHLTSRLRARERGGIEGERQARALYDLLRSLSESRELEAGGLDHAIKAVERVFQAQAAVLRPDAGGEMACYPAGLTPLSENEKSAAALAWERRKWSGRQTDLMPDAATTYIPLLSGGRNWGVLAVQLSAEDGWTALRRELMESFATLLATMLEREDAMRQRRSAQLAIESQKLQRALVDNFSHEMKTPLSIVATAIQHLQQQPSPATKEEVLTEASIAVSRLSLVVSEMVDLAQLDSGILHPTIEWCDAADVLREWVEGKNGAFSANPLRMALSDHPVYMRADLRLLSTALDNILLNALRHAPPGSPVDVALLVRGDRAVIQIADCGPGISAGDEARVFDRFYRGAGEAPGGLGLGLSIARQFIELIGGRIIAGSRPEGGACFSVELPCTRSLPLAEETA
jgi:two-component system, OmpR family, sensor histidine kinase KdpD